MKILLVGNPNAGKTTLFNALTGAHGHTGNYCGVTVGVSERASRFPGLGTVCDLPGLYSFDGMSMEERAAGEYIARQRESGEPFLAVHVADASSLVRSLRLTYALLDMGVPVVLALTMCGRFRRRGGTLDCEKVGRSLGVPCFEVNALRKKSAAAFAASLARISPGAVPPAFPRPEIPAGYVAPPARERKIDGLFLNGWIALPAFFLAAGLVFFLTFGRGMPGDLGKSLLEAFFSRLAEWAGGRISSPLVRSLVCDGLIAGVGGVLSFLPQIALMYLFLELLEESGFMSVLAFMTDGLFARIGLSGRAAFSVLLGYGCTAAAVSSTRALENRSVQRRAVAALFFVPCSAKLPVYLTLLSSVFENTFLGAVLLYVLGTGMGLLLAAFLRREDGDFVMELTEICLPDFLSVCKKLIFRVKQFIIKVSATVLVFTVAVWFLSSFFFSGPVPAEESFLAKLCGVLRYAFYPMGIDDWRAAFAAVSGLVAKENIAGMLAVLYPEGPAFSLPSACAYLTFVALIPPCVSALAACARELGGKTACLYAALQTLFAFLCAYLVYFLLTGGGAALLSVLCGAGIVAAVCGAVRKFAKKRKRKKERERIYGG